MDSMDKKVKQYLSSLDIEPFIAVNDDWVDRGLRNVLSEFREKTTRERINFIKPKLYI